MLRPAVRRGRPDRRRAGFVALLALAGCVPGLGPLVLPAVEGKLVDRESREPIAGAEIVQVYRTAGTGGADPPVLHSRWTRTDRQGSFVFGSELARSPRMWLLETYDPRYDAYHPDYGLVRGPSTDAPRVLLEASLQDAAQRRMDLHVFCSSTADDAGSRHLQDIACPERGAR